MEKRNVVGLTEIVPKVAERVGISQNKAKKFTKALKDAIAKEIKGGNDVAITGLVNFKHFNAAERTVHLRGKEQFVPAHEVVKAHASKMLYK